MHGFDINEELNPELSLLLYQLKIKHFEVDG